MFKKKRNIGIEYNPTAFSFKKYAWKQFKKNKAALFSFYLLCFLTFVALFASFIANDQPLYAKYRGKTFWPAFNQHWIAQEIFGVSGIDSTQNPNTGNWERLQYDITDWKKLELESVVFTLIPHSPKKTDIYNRDFVAPSDEHYVVWSDGKAEVAKGKFRHRLGTDVIGRDVLAGIIHGTKISLLVGIVSMGIAVLIGLFFGSIAGYFGDHRLKLSRIRLLLFVPGIFLGYFYGFIVRSYTISNGFEIGFYTGIFHFLISLLLFFGIPVLISYSGKMIKKGYWSQEIYVPIDSYISRFIEIFNSLPRLLLIITLSAVIQERSLWLVMVIIGLTGWTEIARFTRAELLKIRELDYIHAARVMGYDERRIIFKHALPNALSPVFVSIAFGIASAILIESGLSFLNIGVPDDIVTWGSMLNIGRTEPEAWWMIVFPGIAIFLTITVYNLIGEGLRDALDPRLKK